MSDTNPSGSKLTEGVPSVVEVQSNENQPVVREDLGQENQPVVPATPEISVPTQPQTATQVENAQPVEKPKPVLSEEQKRAEVIRLSNADLPPDELATQIANLQEIQEET